MRWRGAADTRLCLPPRNVSGDEEGGVSRQKWDCIRVSGVVVQPREQIRRIHLRFWKWIWVGFFFFFSRGNLNSSARFSKIHSALTSCAVFTCQTCHTGSIKTPHISVSIFILVYLNVIIIILVPLTFFFFKVKREFSLWLQLMLHKYIWINE